MTPIAVGNGRNPHGGRRTKYRLARNMRTMACLLHIYDGAVVYDPF